MINYIKTLNNIKNAINLKRKNIKIKKTKYALELTTYLLTTNIIKNKWEDKNWLHLNINQKNKIKIVFLKKKFNKKNFNKEIRNSSSIFFKNRVNILARLDF